MYVALSFARVPRFPNANVILILLVQDLTDLLPVDVFQCHGKAHGLVGRTDREFVSQFGLEGIDVGHGDLAENDHHREGWQEVWAGTSFHGLRDGSSAGDLP